MRVFLTSRLDDTFIEQVASTPGVERVMICEPGWQRDVHVGDVVVADHWCNLDDVERAGSNGARWLHILASGVDRFRLDRLDYPTISCSRGTSATAIAEYVFAMLLAKEKRLSELHRTGSLRLPLGELKGSTLAIAGFGAVGSATAHIATAFGMHVVAMRRRPPPLQDPPPGVEWATSALALVKDADHIVLAAPLTAATTGMVDAELLGAMRTNAHLINIARGRLVDTEALLSALNQGSIAHASLDVTEPEPLPCDHPLRHHERATVTNHVSGLVGSADERNRAPFLENLRRIQTGELLIGTVDRRHGY